MKKLILCAGATKKDGWLTLDLNPENKPDFLATIPPLPDEVRSRRWDAIEWIHGIGSLDPWEAKKVINQIRECLAPEGLLILEQPNLLEAAQEILRDPSKIWWMFGDPSHEQPGMMNRWAYTRESLTELLRQAGFSRVKCMDPQYHSRCHRDFRAEAQI